MACVSQGRPNYQIFIFIPYQTILIQHSTCDQIMQFTSIPPTDGRPEAFCRARQLGNSYVVRCRDQ